LSAADADIAALIEAMPMAVAVFGADRLLRFANRHARTLLAMEARNLGDAPTVEKALAPVMTDVGPLLRTATAGVTNHVTTARLRDASGAEQLVEVRVSLAGQGLLVFVATDVTSRETLLISLERRARELAAIFDVTPTMVRVLDASGAIVRANANAMREHPGNRPGTIGALWERDLPAETSDLRLLPLERHPGTLAISGETVRSRLLSVCRGPDNNRVVIEVFAAPVFDADHRIMGAVMVDRDVTSEHRLALDLAAQVKRSALLHERVSTEAERLDRMVDERSRELLALQETRSRERRLAAVGQLAAGVMHDVNNALNPIMAAAYLLRLHADNPDAVRDYADRIGKAAETGAATASRVGRFIRQEPTSADANEFMDLSVLTEEVLAFTAPLHAERRGDGTHVEFVRAYAAGVTTRGLSGEIREALLNLVQNAMHAMPSGGTITVRTGITGADAWVSITDTGQGMSDDVRERAFEPFFSTKGAAGSGLGLAEVYGIVRRHRGRAEIASVVGDGTTVTLYFPFEVPTAAVVQTEERGAIAPQRVLIVEDHDDGREFLRQLLLADGHAVEVVSTYAAAALRLDVVDPPPFDVLLTDIGLPDGSGWKLVSFTRAHWPAMRIGVVTGWEPTVVDDDTDGADFILRKPLRAVELLARVAGHEPREKSERTRD
jgi:signal transduction histidine kinase/CheY-like chemotaxis protein